MSIRRKTSARTILRRQGLEVIAVPAPFTEDGLKYVVRDPATGSGTSLDYESFLAMVRTVYRHHHEAVTGFPLTVGDDQHWRGRKQT